MYSPFISLLIQMVKLQWCFSTVKICSYVNTCPLRKRACKKKQRLRSYAIPRRQDPYVASILDSNPNMGQSLCVQVWLKRPAYQQAGVS